MIIARVQMFQSTLPHGARHGALPHSVSAVRFQSTRPHGARPDCREDTGVGWLVSIHAPARGATVSVSRMLSETPFQSTRPHGARHGIEAAQRVQVVVSIHAPARGATDSPASLSTEVLFQSTRPHGARRALQQRALGWFGFNPRARTGRDSRDKQREEQRRCFNPRARTGRDPPGMTASTPARAFQSTRPHGARPSLRVIDQRKR